MPWRNSRRFCRELIVTSIRRSACPGQFRRLRPEFCGIGAVLFGCLCFATPLVAQTTAQPRRAIRPDWKQRDTSDVFYRNAFRDVLHGEPPAEDAGGTLAETRDTSSSARDPQKSAADEGAGLSPSAIEDEIKSQAAGLRQRLTTPAKFTEDVQIAAGQDLVLLSLLFEMLRKSPSGARWQRHAEAARDRCAAVASVLPASAPQAFQQTRSVLDELQELMNGNPRPFASDVPSASYEYPPRDVLMLRMEAAIEEHVSADLADRQTFDATRSRSDHELQIVAALSDVLCQEGMEDADDPEYQALARGLVDASQAMRKAVERGEYDAARQALVRVKESCTQCHDSYR